MDSTSFPPLPYFNERITITQLAVAFGYTEYRPKSYRNGKCMILGSSSDPVDEVLISPSSKHPGQEHYVDLSNDYDAGSSAALFTKHCMEKGLVPDPLPADADWKHKVASILANYLSMPLEQRLQFSSVPQSDYKPFDPESAKLRLIPLADKSLLRMREITPCTIEAEPFKNTIFSDALASEEPRLKDNLLFPLYYSNETLGGINIRYYNQHDYKHKSKIMKGSDHASTIWHSNIPEKIDAIFVAESEYDCMSHFQLTQKPNTLYVAHQGYLMPKQVDVVYDLIRNNREKLSKDFKLLLGSDNDVNGAKYDLRFIITAARNSQDHKCEIMDQPSPNSSIYNDVAVAVREDLYEPFKLATKDFMDTNEVHVPVQFLDDKHLVVMPHSKDDFFTDRTISQIILNQGIIVKNIQLEKAIKKDWNDDVKELNRINHKIQMYLHSDKQMNYNQFREIYPKHFVECRSTEFVNTVVRKIAAELPEPEKLNEMDAVDTQKNGLKM